MDRLGSLLDRSRDALLAAAGQAVSVVEAGQESTASHEESLLSALMPRAFASEMDDFVFQDVPRVADWRNVMLWTMAIAICLIIAAGTNPNEASFRSFLTELSFRRHLVDIQDIPDDHKLEYVPPTSDTPIAPFRFANHVSISLRTPTLYYKTLYVFSVALTSPIGPPLFLSDPISLVRNRGHVPRERLVLYIGYLGHWVQIGIVPRRLEAWFEKDKRKKDRAGVTDLRAIQEEVKPKGRIGPADLAPESRRASIVSLLPDDSPAVIALKADLTKAQDACSELKGQLFSHEQSVSDAHASLQATLDDLRIKRKEDDAERSEIKSKTKALEEQKRQAEAGKREAERKLKAAEGQRDAVLAKVDMAKKEMVEARASIEASERAARGATEDGARFIVETQETTELRHKELDEVEVETGEVEKEMEELVLKIQEAEERLKMTHQKGYKSSAVANAIVGKNLAPEEEMSMMAAAYEVAAQEGYRNDPNWASQAAAYMEAGMPSLDQNYTARPNPGRTASQGKRLTELMALDDLESRDKRLSGEGFGQVLGLAANRLAHAHEQDEISEYDDPASPNGGISTSFSANLLGQGLFNSLLGGDQMPTDNEETTLEEALNFGPVEVLEGSDEETDEAKKRFFPASPLNARTSAPPVPVLPSLPALPGSRRWFSGTMSASAENLHSFPSTDSLVTHPPNQGSGASTTAGSLYESSPFAPSESERKKLGGMWQMGGIGKRFSSARTDLKEEPLGRSTSLDLPAHARGQSAPVRFGTSPQQSWMARHLHLNGEETSNRFEVTPEEEAKEKSTFKLFSPFRKPSAKLGSSPGAQSSSSSN